jgi:Raf kinase inhibitor-like YbhB/YbcL family protein
MQELDVQIDFDKFPQRYTCDGEDISPGITIRGLSEPYVAVIIDDPDNPGGRFTHWLAWNIKATDRIPEGIPPESRIEHPISVDQGMNDFRRVGYGGPCPSRGELHRYVIRVYGVKTEINLPPGAARIDLEDVLKATATQYGETTAICEREEVLVAPGSL